MQYIYRFSAPKHEWEPFGLSEPVMSKKAMARIVLFTKTVKDLLPKLFGFDYEITVGIKVLEPKKKGFKQYGTYIILGRKFITENSADDIFLSGSPQRTGQKPKKTYTSREWNSKTT